MEKLYKDTLKTKNVFIQFKKKKVLVGYPNYRHLIAPTLVSNARLYNNMQNYPLSLSAY